MERKKENGEPYKIPALRLPALSGSWALCTEGLAHPHTQEIRPIVFNYNLSQGHDDVVLAHLNHRLVMMCLRLLRAEVWSTEGKKRLHRVTARLVPDAVLRDLGFREEPRGANVWIVVPKDGGVFDGSEERNGISCVHPVQAYVDLRGQPERAKEAAAELRARLLRPRAR